MGEWMGDVLDAVSARIKAPYFGYAVLAFFALNWRAIFVLLMTEASPEERISAFDAQTSSFYLFIAPLLVGAVVAATAAWIRFAFEYISSKPVIRVELLYLDAEHQKILKTVELEAARSQMITKRELEAIERAKRDEKISKEITNPAAKHRAQQEIEKIRATEPAFGSEQENLSDRETRLLLAAAADGSGEVYVDQKFIEVGNEHLGHDSSKEFKLFRASVQRLLRKGLLERSEDDQFKFELSARGWALVDNLEAAENLREQPVI